MPLLTCLPAPVSNDNRIDLVVLPIVDHRGHLTDVVLGEEHSAWTPVQYLDMCLIILIYHIEEALCTYR